ncbi:hypothetical protein BH10BAC2_BH10BAC2_07620 [soil metagenome]
MKHFVFLLLVFITSTCAYTQEVIPGQTIYSSNFDIDGISRTCTFYIPLGYGKSEACPLVIMLHDRGSNAKNIIKSYGDIMHANADSISAIVIYPEAVADGWKDGTEKDSINDVGYLSILTDYFVQRYHADPTRVFITGLGNGAAMAYRFGCDLPGKVAALVAFTNTDSKSNCINLAVPVMRVSGKVNAVSINNVFEFFMLHRKE